MARVCVVFVLATAALARADSLILQGQSPQTVTVTAFDGATLEFRTSGGSRSSRPYEKVKQLVVDNEPALSAAEANNAGGKAAASIDDYVKALRSTVTPWVKAYAGRRLTDVLGAGTDRFDARLAIYLAATQAAVADAEARRPPLPDKGSRLLDVAVADVETALKASGQAEATNVVLLNFLADVHRRRGDEAAVSATYDRLAKLSPAAANDPAYKARQAGQKVSQAKAALSRREYAAAKKLIDDHRAAITDPRLQSDALLVLAQVADATADATDRGALQDAALAYLRVAAVSGPIDGRPNVLAGLQGAAAALERAGEKAEAGRLLTQITREFAGDAEAVGRAKGDLGRLGG